MITKRTVIVVGAGASKDLNLPLGFELQNSVAELLAETGSDFYRYFRSAVAQVFDNNHDRVEAALQTAVRLSRPMKTAASVDNFLDQHREDKDFVTVAKLAIANCVALAERHCLLSGTKDSIEYINSCPDYFMLSLLNILVRGHQPDNIGNSIRNLTFVIFNYDRCVERYFEKWLSARFGLRARDILDSAKFIHVYGSLGNYFDRHSPMTFEYDGRYAFQNPHHELPAVGSGIRIFTEQEDSDVAESISNAVHVAEVMLFLGFGFEEQNMRFFGGSANEKRVFATVFGQSVPNTVHIDGILSERYSRASKVNIFGGKAKGLFEDYYHPITSAVGSLGPVV